jgi:hypothetical protein
MEINKKISLFNIDNIDKTLADRDGRRFVIPKEVENMSELEAKIMIFNNTIDTYALIHGISIEEPRFCGIVYMDEDIGKKIRKERMDSIRMVPGEIHPTVVKMGHIEMS